MVGVFTNTLLTVRHLASGTISGRIGT